MALSRLWKWLGRSWAYARTLMSVEKASPKSAAQAAADYFGEYHTKCEAVFRQSMAEPNLSKIAKSHRLVDELAVWIPLIKQRREVELIEVAAHEYDYSLLALAQGHYRHAFKSMRLVLELTLQAIYLSANELRLREWLSNRVDTSWSAIVDQREGVFSSRFAKGFFPSFETHAAHYGGMAALLYRECSECVHGNMPHHIPLPKTIAFDQTTFDLWHGKADILRLVTNSALALRYFNDISAGERPKLVPCINHLTQVPEIRAILPAAPMP